MKIRIKICGITRIEDALAACELGVDAVGFVFHRPSPRYIEPSAAARITSRLPAFLATVGVFVDLAQAEVRKIAALAGLSCVQLHGSEPPDYCRSLGLRWIKAFRLGKPEDLEELAAFGGGDLLLDSRVEGQAGGTGRTFNWQWAGDAGRYGRIILAGGLRPENLAEAIRIVRPDGVDVSSAVEKAPGVKDREKMKAFVEAVRSLE